MHTSPASSDNTSELQDALEREQSLRKAAEAQLSQASSELEELTVQLFSQANEMVAQERKARAKLEERVAVLERRDVEKRGRLERLEKAMARVERLRALVN
jgi:low affinity Fe/Cu permease